MQTYEEFSPTWRCGSLRSTDSCSTLFHLHKITNFEHAISTRWSMRHFGHGGSSNQCPGLFRAISSQSLAQLCTDKVGVRRLGARRVGTSKSTWGYTHRRLNVGPASQTSAQHWAENGPVCGVTEWVNLYQFMACRACGRGFDEQNQGLARPGGSGTKPARGNHPFMRFSRLFMEKRNKLLKMLRLFFTPVIWWFFA